MVRQPVALQSKNIDTFVTISYAIAHYGTGVNNGRGDPEPLDYAQETIRGILGKKPIFGICLGHNLREGRPF